MSKKKKLPTVRKPTAPPTRKIRTRKGEPDRKKKHKEEITDTE